MEPVSVDPPPPEVPALEAPAEEPLAAASPDERLHLARERARHGDWEGTRLVLEPLLGAPPPHGFTARYLAALSTEFEGDLAGALAAYDALIAEDPTPDVRFRRAETLGKLGRFDEARAALRELDLGREVGAVDLVKLEALDGVWSLESGRVRRGQKHLRALVEAPPSEEPTFYLALARLTLLREAARQAAALEFEGPDRRRATTLQQRAKLVLEAEHQLADLIRLGETRAALDGFVEVAGVYLALGDDLHAEPTPAGLTEAQASIYREELGARVLDVWKKSLLYCDKGLEYAARQDWVADPVGGLTAAKGVATTRIEGAL